MTAQGTRLVVARIAAVALALGLSSWLVVRAHRSANMPPPSEAQDGLPNEGGGLPTDEPMYLPSTTSTIGVGGGAGGAFREGPPERRARKRAVFLPSSKSLPYEESFGRSAGLAEVGGVPESVGPVEPRPFPTRPSR